MLGLLANTAPAARKPGAWARLNPDFRGLHTDGRRLAELVGGGVLYPFHEGAGGRTAGLGSPAGLACRAGTSVSWELGSLGPGVEYVSTASDGAGAGIVPATPVALPVGTDLTLIVRLRILGNNGDNPGFWRDGVAAQGGSFFITQAGARPWVRWAGVDILKPTAGPTIGAGLMTLAYVVKSGAYVRFFQNGQLQHGATHAAALSSAAAIYQFGWQYATQVGFNAVYDYLLVAPFALSDGAVAAWAADPLPARMWMPTGARWWLTPSTGAPEAASATLQGAALLTADGLVVPAGSTASLLAVASLTASGRLVRVGTAALCGATALVAMAGGPVIQAPVIHMPTAATLADAGAVSAALGVCGGLARPMDHGALGAALEVDRPAVRLTDDGRGLADLG